MKNAKLKIKKSGRGWLGEAFSIPMNRLSQMTMITSLRPGESSWHNRFYAHPHPGPLPRGEGESVAAFWQTWSVLVHGFNAQILWGNLTLIFSRPPLLRYGATGWDRGQLLDAVLKSVYLGAEDSCGFTKPF
jgi:hypothetical protein